MIKIPKVPVKFTLEMFELFGGRCSRGSKPENYTPFYEDYSVTINGQDCPVRECRVSAMPFNRRWPGKQRDMSQTELAGFISFSGDEKVVLRVKRKSGFETAIVRPVSKKIVPEIIGDEVVFEIEENGSYVLELDGEHNALHIFYNKVKEYPDAEKATYYFGPGLHCYGNITLKDNESVYIDEEAIVFGSINAVSAKNIRIFGGGTIDNSNEERIIEHCYENTTKGTFRIYNCQNVSVEDVILTNSSTWILSMFYCDNVNIDGVKLIGHWRYNADGIDVVNTSNVTIKNSFIRSFDDVISIKGIYEYNKPIKNIFIENCVLWCGWGHTCELGVESWAPEYNNISFKDCDVVRISGPSMAICNGMHADIHNVKYENINIEMQADTLTPQMQQSDDQVYEAEKSGMRRFRLIYIGNDQYPVGKNDSEPYNVQYCEKLGYTHDVEFKNINLYTDDESILPIVEIYSISPDVPVEDVCIDGLYFNGKKQETLDAFKTTIMNAENIVIK